MHILVAEDNKVVQKLLGPMLNNYGCTYSIVSTGQQALDYLANLCPGSRPDVIIMDVRFTV
ncbi:hypothetical protein EYZ11_000422 [Aspergillus tanneri]|uniref:Response regulatory domain-containing protein n=1 Tax=Aspergillus tanneri TaxID=1220188 RepID=A0A4S3JX51_9EURO|nr:hypothetical protein EYZ11_000422 [Aspergillus tanneri]